MSPTPAVLPRTGRGTAASTPAGNEAPPDWDWVQERLRSGGWFWLATVAKSGAPHVRPVFAAWNGTAFLLSSNQAAAKTRNLDADPRSSLTVAYDDLHLVAEGSTRRLRGEGELLAASTTFSAVYDWPTTPTDDDRLDAPYGAPTSGGPPYRVYELDPERIFTFPVDGELFAPTRWEF
jgi:hypothetical protein